MTVVEKYGEPNRGISQRMEKTGFEKKRNGYFEGFSITHHDSTSLIE
jgi:hypothetical protein